MPMIFMGDLIACMKYESKIIFQVKSMDNAYSLCTLEFDLNSQYEHEMYGRYNQCFLTFLVSVKIVYLI